MFTRSTTLALVTLVLIATMTMLLGVVTFDDGPDDFDLTWFRVAGGGETFLMGDDFELSGTIGQPEAGVMTGGDYELAGGFWVGGAAADAPSCQVPADLNCDDVVDGADLSILLSDWGECPDCDDCPADLNGDCVVDGADLLILLSNWG